MTVAEAMDQQHALTCPKAIQVRASGRLTEAVSYRFADGRTFSDTRRVA
jgi:DNA repair protein RadD